MVLSGPNIPAWRWGKAQGLQASSSGTGWLSYIASFKEVLNDSIHGFLDTSIWHVASLDTLENWGNSSRLLELRLELSGIQFDKGVNGILGKACWWARRCQSEADCAADQRKHPDDDQGPLPLTAHLQGLCNTLVQGSLQCIVSGLL